MDTCRNVGTRLTSKHTFQNRYSCKHTKSFDNHKIAFPHKFPLKQRLGIPLTQLAHNRKPLHTGQTLTLRHPNHIKECPFNETIPQFTHKSHITWMNVIIPSRSVTQDMPPHLDILHKAQRHATRTAHPQTKGRYRLWLKAYTYDSDCLGSNPTCVVY